MSEAGSAAPINTVYAERNAAALAFAALALAHGWLAGVRYGDDPDWPVLFVETHAGQVSWHIPAADAEGFPAYAGEWDGHDEAEKARRLEECAALLTARHGA